MNQKNKHIIKAFLNYFTYRWGIKFLVMFALIPMIILIVEGANNNPYGIEKRTKQSCQTVIATRDKILYKTSPDLISCLEIVGKHEDALKTLQWYVNTPENLPWIPFPPTTDFEEKSWNIQSVFISAYKNNQMNLMNEIINLYGDFEIKKFDKNSPAISFRTAVFQPRPEICSRFQKIKDSYAQYIHSHCQSS